MKPIEIAETPITDATFEAQGWERRDEEDRGEKFYYWVLPLPKDNPDNTCPCLISCANDEYEDVGIPKGTYAVEIFNLNGLGFTVSEEGIELIYKALTNRDIMESEIEPDVQEEIEEK